MPARVQAPCSVCGFDVAAFTRQLREATKQGYLAGVKDAQRDPSGESLWERSAIRQEIDAPTDRLIVDAIGAGR